jgi:sugar/nucleoside kinase (ribokinase family)
MATIDFVRVLAHHPAEDSENAVLESVTVVGGPVGRGAIAASRLGVGVEIVATCGDDIFADILRGQVADEGISADWYAEHCASQHSFVIVAREAGSRTTVWTGQPKGDQEVARTMASRLSGFTHVLLDCTDEVLTRAVLRVAKESDVVSVIDTGSFKAWSLDVLSDVDHVVSPEKFFTSGWPELEPLDAAQRCFDSWACSSVCVTMGSRGYAYIDRDGLHVHPALLVDVVDSCGAGDTFHGAFAAALTAGMKVSKAYATAGWVAGMKCAALGNQGIPTLNEAISAGVVARSDWTPSQI